MFKSVAVVAFFTIVAATAVRAEDKPALTCKDLTMPLKGWATDLSLSISLTPAQLTAQCASAAGDALTLVSPKGGISLAPAAGEVKIATFTVQDSHGYTASAKVTVSRN